MRRTLLRMFAAIFGVAALTTVLSVSVATPASALVDCTGNTAHQDRSSGNNYLISGKPIRSGVYAECTVRSWGPMTVAMDCWVTNRYNHVWWFVHGSDGSQGWAYEPNLYYNIVRTSGNRCDA